VVPPAASRSLHRTIEMTQANTMEHADRSWWGIDRLLVRRARGGKAQPGAAMPMHPMQGMVGLVSGLFGKPRQAADPPAGDGEGTKNERAVSLEANGNHTGRAAGGE
jgi:hypothetical protein